MVIAVVRVPINIVSQDQFPDLSALMALTSLVILAPWAQQLIDGLETLRTQTEAIRNLLVTDLSEVKSDLSDMKVDVSQMKADVRALREDVTTIKALREDIHEVKSKMVTVSRFINTLHIERAKVPISPHLFILASCLHLVSCCSAVEHDATASYNLP